MATKKRNTRLGRKSSKRARPDRGEDLQRHVLRVFEEQADSLWSRLAGHCREFADGFNRAVGSPVLTVEADGATVRVAYPRAETELLMQLDKSDRVLVARVSNGCDETVCTTCGPALPVGLTVRGDQLQMVLRGDITPDEQVAVTLLTELTQGTLE